MKKLISILTLASFSLVPTTNIIACENGDNSDDEIVGETIAQEIVDGAIKDLNKRPIINEHKKHIKFWIEDKARIKEIIPNIEKKPEYIIMTFILMECLTSIIANDSKNISDLNLNTQGVKVGRTHELLAKNLKKFRVVSEDTEWFENIKKENLNEENSKKYKFKLKFGKTLSNETISFNLYWD